MSDEIVISVKNVSKDFKLAKHNASTLKSAFANAFRKKENQKAQTQHALRNVSFEIKKGEFFGIVGRNGSGKSTLLKMLAGIYVPNSGEVRVTGKLVPFIELGVGFNPELTGRENVYLNGALLGFSKSEVDDFYDEVVEFAELELFMDQKLKNYSSGMQVRLAFSMAIRSEAEILLVDEILAVGDADFQRKCFEYFQQVKGKGITVVFVTHDMNAVREYCGRAILIEKSKIVSRGSASDVARDYTRMFMEADDSNSSKRNETRWGDSAVRFTKVKAPSSIKDSQDLVFEVEIQASMDIEKVNVGFLIKNAAKVELLGTNIEILDMNHINLKKNEKAVLKWTVPNVFNDGIYYIDPAIVYNGNTQVADWWENAASFRSKKVQKTPYLTSPSIKCSINETN